MRAALFLLGAAACCARLSVAPTIDTLGHFGVDARLTLGLGHKLATRGEDAFALLGTAEIGGGLLGTEGAGAGQLALGGSLMVRSRHEFTHSAGLFYGHRFLSTGGGRISSLHGLGASYLFTRRLGELPFHLGPELRFEYLFADPVIGLDRGIIALGPTFDFSILGVHDD